MNAPYFIVHALEMTDGFVLVDGRLGEVEVKVGHFFTRCFPTAEAWRRKEDFMPCAVEVRGIEAYRYKLDELSPGMTARLSLVGSHLSALKSTTILE